jgi:hypothetical protein
MIELTNKDKEMLEMWAKGVTSGELASHFKVTRNAIMGRLNRLRKAGFVDYKKQAPLAKQPVKKISMTTVVLGRKQEREFLQDFFQKKEQARQHRENITLMELKHDSCRYVTSGEKASEYRFCGKKIWEKSYCEDHHKLCMVPPQRRSTKSGPFTMKRLGHDPSIKPSPSGQNS